MQPVWYTLRPRNEAPYVKAIQWTGSDSSTREVIAFVGEESFCAPITAEDGTVKARLWNMEKDKDVNVYRYDYVVANFNGTGFCRVSESKFEKLYQ